MGNKSSTENQEPQGLEGNPTSVASPGAVPGTSNNDTSNNGNSSHHYPVSDNSIPNDRLPYATYINSQLPSGRNTPPSDCRSIPMTKPLGLTSPSAEVKHQPSLPRSIHSPVLQPDTLSKCNTTHLYPPPIPPNNYTGSVSQSAHSVGYTSLNGAIARY
jgi:hypothetical protein